MTDDNPALAEARLRALARSVAGADLATVDADVAGGVGRDGDRGFFYVDDDPRAVGRAVRWALAQGLDRVDILAANGAADLARRATHLAGPPALGVWTVDGADVRPAEPCPCPAPPELPAEHWALAGVLTEVGAHPIDDHGVLVGEVAGLEVARVVDGPDGPTIDIGVGQADRELNQLVHSQLDADTGLRRVIAAVADLRTRHLHHPLTRVARERWLRSALIDDPTPVGAVELTPLVPLRPRSGLLAPEPSACAGTLASGQPVVVVAMVGVDLDLLPEAADYRQRWNPEAAIVVVTPPRDLSLNTPLLDRVPNATAVPVEGPWSP